jgi:hypothetical protein
MAEVYNKVVAGVNDKTVILATREWLIYPFRASNWQDLRIGFFLSLCTAGADDPPSPITGLTETIPIPAVAGPQDRYWIGVKDASTVMPNQQGSAFIGFCNDITFAGGRGDSVLQSSDIGVGTTNTNYWRPGNAMFRTSLGGIFSGPFVVGHSSDGIQNHYPQDVTGAGGYAVAIGLRLQRALTNPNMITATVKKNVHSSDLLFSNTPTRAVLEAALRAWPTNVQQWGPAQVAPPTALYCYWPFTNSRLRIHSCGLVKVK